MTNSKNLITHKKRSFNPFALVVPRGIAPLRYHAGAGKRSTAAFASSARSKIQKIIKTLKSHDQFANKERIAFGREMKKQVSKRCFLTFTAKTSRSAVFSFGSPKGNRTPDSAVRGWRLNRLTMGPCEINDNILSLKSTNCKNIFKIYLKSLSFKTF